MFRNSNYDKYNLYFYKNIFNLKFYDNEVPQGLCIINNKVYITCYKIDNTNSCVIELSMQGDRLRTIDLKNRSHVGGIGYDETHNVVFICDVLGKVSAYKYNSFERIKSFNIANSSGSKLLENGKLVCSYLTCHNNKLYVGSFNLRKNGIVKIYDVVRDKEGIELIYNKEFLVPKKTQGLTFFDYNNNYYLILSNSYGRKNNSGIIIARYSDNIVDYRKEKFKILLPPMLEQIEIYDNNLVLLFESSAYKYKFTCPFVVDKLVSLDIDKIIREFENE